MTKDEIRKNFENDMEQGYVYFDKMFNQFVYLYCGEEIMCGGTEDEAYSVYADIVRNDIEQFGADAIQYV